VVVALEGPGPAAEALTGAWPLGRAADARPGGGPPALPGDGGGQTAHAVTTEIVGLLIGVEFILLRSFSGAFRSIGAAQPGVVFRALGSFVCLVVEQARFAVLSLWRPLGLVCRRCRHDGFVLVHGVGGVAAPVGVDAPERRPDPGPEKRHSTPSPRSAADSSCAIRARSCA